MSMQTIKQELENTGLPWDIERGSRHLKLKLSGHLVGILPGDGRSAMEGRALKNVVSQIRRAARKLA